MSNLGKLNKKRGFKGVYSEMIGGGETGFDFTQQYLTEACSHRYDIRLVTVLCLAKEHIVPAIIILQSHGRSVDLIELIAGTRTRYLIIGEEKK
ncbi:MAG: hypothetical protein IH840_05830 [Candidatus Heimdallarchaeota archaeon]|nr:hypothetical protein [Candidatus Heimdallarchaeota archaeon]